MPNIPITIVHKPNGNLEPLEDNQNTAGKKTKVRHGDAVQFGVGPNIVGVSIRFEGESPFGDTEDAKTVLYGVAHIVTKAIRPGGPAQNTYRYTCTAKTTDGQTLTSSPSAGSGGEMEVGG